MASAPRSPTFAHHPRSDRGRGQGGLPARSSLARIWGACRASRRRPDRRTLELRRPPGSPGPARRPPADNRGDCVASPALPGRRGPRPQRKACGSPTSRAVQPTRYVDQVASETTRIKQAKRAAGVTQLYCPVRAPQTVDEAARSRCHQLQYCPTVLVVKAQQTPNGPKSLRANVARRDNCDRRRSRRATNSRFGLALADPLPARARVVSASRDWGRFISEH